VCVCVCVCVVPLLQMRELSEVGDDSVTSGPVISTRANAGILVHFRRKLC
jgi:hypothetical protein